MSTLLVTGGAGFIGANYVLRRHAQNTADRLVVLDALTYAGYAGSLAPLDVSPRFRFVKGDISDAALVRRLFEEERPEAVVHFAAESHVDRSILGPGIFTTTNILGTQTLLEAALSAKARRFVMISTDEVYGSLRATGSFSEQSPLDPSSPYSASKAGADLMCLAYHRTFGLDVVVTRCSNNYGPLQFPEKLIPLMIINALESKPLPVYGDGMQVRDWIHVEDHCAAVDRVLELGVPGEVYNVGARCEQHNIDVVRLILDHLGRPASLIRHVTDRPAHDRRYAIDPTKIERDLGWGPTHSFEQALPETIDWYVANRAWWEAIRSGAYRDHYDRWYGARLSGSGAES